MTPGEDTAPLVIGDLAVKIGLDWGIVDQIGHGVGAVQGGVGGDIVIQKMDRGIKKLRFLVSGQNHNATLFGIGRVFHDFYGKASFGYFLGGNVF